MKIHLSCVVALSLLASDSIPIWAQPAIVPPEVVVPQPQPNDADFERADDSADALAFIGAFYHKLSRAESYRGHLVTVTTTSSKGKVLATKTVEMDSSWIADKEIQGAFRKAVSSFVVTNVRDGQTTNHKFRTVDNGIKSYRFNGAKNIWSERVQEEGETTLMFDAVHGPWMIALAMFGAGRKFEIEDLTVDGQDQVLVRSKPEDEYVFDAKTGDLKSYTRTVALEREEDYITRMEGRWLQHEFNVPLADALFDWKTPDGTEKVAPEKISIEAYLVGP